MPTELAKWLLDQTRECIPHFLRNALLEWTIITMLFLDGLISFISNEFARYFGLKTPCLLCTRIDHLLIQRSPNFYCNESICDAHKKDISSLGYCNLHKKLSDNHSMCQPCLVSIDKDPDKSTTGNGGRLVDDDRRLLLRRLKKDDGELSDDKSGISINPLCSCCGENLKPRPTKKLLRNLSTKSPHPSPRMSPRMSWFAGRNDEIRDTPRSRFTEVKFMTDVELEAAPNNDASNGDNQAGKEDIRATITPFLQDGVKELYEDPNRTPSFMRSRSNKYFGLDPIQESPRWLNRNRSSKKLNFDKVDTFVEPFDISLLNELDGDLLNRLKKQVHLDHDSLMAVYNELDKERSAAAVAANNAMAMITRIQQEKAAIQMEALQYQRMMEEQAEYDEEALQILRDLLIKKEDDMKELESELDAYRVRYGDITKIGSDICEADSDDGDGDDDLPEMKSHSSERSDHGGDVRGCEDPYEGPKEEVLSLDFEGERSYLLGLLAHLEKKMNADKESDNSEMETVKNDDVASVTQEGDNKAALTREVSLIKERLKVVEADSGFLKHAAKTMQMGDEGVRVLKEIAEHLQILRQSTKSPPNKTEA